MPDILFDEKIAGSFHFTPGQAHEGKTESLVSRAATDPTVASPISAQPHLSQCRESR